MSFATFETEADRIALLEFSGFPVRFAPASGSVDTVAIVRKPDESDESTAFEAGLGVPNSTALVRTSVLAGLRTKDAFEVLEGPFAGTYAVYSVLAEDDGAFSRIVLGRP